MKMNASGISNKLGEYMLKGWVLTDEICPNERCIIPLMRSPKGHVPSSMFCANCDGDLGAQSGSSPARSQPIQRQSSPSITHSSTTHMSRSSTPPTDISIAPSSPTFALPIDTAESIHRRRQSDSASAEIGKRLLKGWAMLADECPNAGCYGVPLVRPPLVGGKDPRKECVVCGIVYIDERDAAGWGRLVAVERQGTLPPSTVVPPEYIDAHNLVPSRGKGKEKATAYISPDGEASAGDSKVADRISHRTSPIPDARLNVLADTSTSLELALHSLSQRLTSLSSLPAVLEPSAIGFTADAMGKVLRVLAQVEKLRDRTGS